MVQRLVFQRKAPIEMDGPHGRALWFEQHTWRLAAPSPPPGALHTAAIDAGLAQIESVLSTTVEVARAFASVALEMMTVVAKAMWVAFCASAKVVWEVVTAAASSGSETLSDLRHQGKVSDEQLVLVLGSLLILVLLCMWCCLRQHGIKMLSGGRAYTELLFDEESGGAPAAKTPPLPSARSNRSSTPRQSTPRRTPRSTPRGTPRDTKNDENAASNVASKKGSSTNGWLGLFNKVSTTPGPGCYDNNRDTLSARSNRSHNLTASRGKASFLTSAERQGVPIEKSGGDPGQYLISTAFLSERSKQSHNQMCKEGKMQFNSTVQRGSGIDRTTTPMLCYDYAHLYGCGQEQASLQMSSSFLSAIPMYGHVQRSTTPPVTRYYPEKPNRLDKTISKAGSSCFAGVSPQHLPDGAGLYHTGASVGPASYYQGHRSLQKGAEDYKNNSRVPGFASSERRGDPTSW